MLGNFQVISIKVEKKVDLSTGLLYFSFWQKKKKKVTNQSVDKSCQRDLLIIRYVILMDSIPVNKRTSQLGS